MNRKVLVPSHCGIVQIIHLRWSKASRGGDGARKRNAVPLGFDVRVDQFADCHNELMVVESSWGERNGFAQPFNNRQRRVKVGDGFSYDCVSVSEHSDGLRVRYQYDRSHGGAPDRWYFNFVSSHGESPSGEFVVRSDEWGRIRYNGRFTDFDGGNWWYEQTTVNVAWFDQSPSGRAFANGAPSHEIKAMADLW